MLEIKNPVSITEFAKKELLHIIANQVMNENVFLRVAVKGSGCSGTSYVLGFDSKNENDLVFDYDGIRTVIDKKHLLYLINVKIDFIDNSRERGFTFDNSN